MKTRYRLFRRRNRGGAFYCLDTKTGKRASLQTSDEDEARQIIEAKNQAERQPVLNLQIAKAYLAGTDSGISQRTWQQALEALTASKRGANKRRWQCAANDKAYDLIRHRVIIETQAEILLKVLREGTVSTNIYLRRLHNFSLDMNWLPWPIIPKRQWPEIKFKEKRGITWEEHQKIVAGESNAELRDYYELLWHLGGSQTDMASLRGEDIDWTNHTISYARMKTGSQAMIRFGDSVAQILQRRPTTGYLFPQIVQWKESDRAKAFIRRLRLVGVSGISLHSYRYAWAERARTCGFPERFAQEALGHGSKAVARAYANKRLETPSQQCDFGRGKTDRQLFGRRICILFQRRIGNHFSIQELRVRQLIAALIVGKYVQRGHSRITVVTRVVTRAKLECCVGVGVGVHRMFH